MTNNTIFDANTKQSPTRKKREILESIKSKYIEKYGSDDHTVDAI